MVNGQYELMDARQCEFGCAKNYYCATSEAECPDMTIILIIFFTLFGCVGCCIGSCFIWAFCFAKSSEEKMPEKEPAEPLIAPEVTKKYRDEENLDVPPPAYNAQPGYQ